MPADISIQRLRGGLCAVWHGPDGRRHRHQLAARTRKEAEAEALDLYRRQMPRQAALTVADLWRAYQEDHAGRRIARNMEWSGTRILASFGARRPDQITVQDCRAFVATGLAEGRKTGTIWTELSHLRICLNWAAKRRMIPAAPHIEKPAAPPPKDLRLTRAEIDRLLSVEAPPHIMVAVILMLTTAARVGAILDLTWDRVDLDRGRIDLRLDADAPRKGRAIVPINATARAVLVTAREAALSDHVVEWGGRKVGSIKKGFAAMAARAGLPHISPHVLRHTAAVLMAEGGVPMEEIAQYLGHTNTETTRRVYARFSPDHLRGAAQVLEFGKVRQVQ